MNMYHAIIPIRSGSKRLPRKNILPFNGKPLFCHTLDIALHVVKIRAIVITTDDPEVKDIIYGKYHKEILSGKIIFLDRDASLAGDTSGINGVIKDVLDRVANIENIILLQATSPLRQIEDIETSIELYEKNDKLGSVVSATEMNPSPYWACSECADGTVEKLFDNVLTSTRSQDLPKAFVPNGAVYIKSARGFVNEESLYGSDVRFYKMPKERSIDIDTRFDFDLAEFLQKNKNYA